MKKLLLASIAVLLLTQVTSAQDVAVFAQNSPDGTREVSIVDPDGKKLWSFIEKDDGSLLMTGDNGQAVIDPKTMSGAEVTSSNSIQIRKKSYHLINDKYQKSWQLNDNDLEFVLQDVQTGEVLYKMLGTNEYIYIYNGKGALIAEGPFKQVKIHDEQAFNDLKQMMSDSE